MSGTHADDAKLLEFNRLYRHMKEGINMMIIAQVLGGDRKILDDVTTVGQVKEKMGVPTYTATVNGQPADNSTVLAEGNIVTLSQAVKGGLN
jgi:hypothetical protein